MKGLVIVGDYFEDVEFIAPIDVWTRHKDEITIVSMLNRLQVTSKLGIPMIVHKLYKEINLDEFDFLFIPGGPGSFQVLANIKEVDEVISYFSNRNKLVCAICAAPMLIGRLGFLKNKNYTIYPGFEREVLGGNYLRHEGVVKDGNIITGKSMYYSIPFALKVIEHFYGLEETNKHELALTGE